MRAWRPSTWATYRAPWNRWLRWTRQHAVSPALPSPEDLALFLSSLRLKDGLSYASICVHKSVVCTLANASDSSSLSGHPLVRGILRAISMEAPVESREIWDINLLFSWMHDNPPSESSLFEVSRHLALLLLLASGRRIHDLTLLACDPLHLQDAGDFIVLWPSFGAKTDSATRRQSGWQLRPHPDPILDSPSWVRRFLTISRRRRGARRRLDSLFITTRGRVGPASRAVIAGWVRTALSAAGIRASPGSVRSAVGSSRYAEGTSVDEILRLGNSRSPTTFFRHYLREIAATPSAPRLPPFAAV